MADVDITIERLEKLTKSSNCPFVVHDALELLCSMRSEIKDLKAQKNDMEKALEHGRERDRNMRWMP